MEYLHTRVGPQSAQEVVFLEDMGADEERVVEREDEATNLGYNPQLGGEEAGDYDAQLDYDRTQQKRKLKSRFEYIFEKYEKDFEGIGDEIDLESGIIVVDNGHLKRMQDEGDVGDDNVLDAALSNAGQPVANGYDAETAGSDEDAEDEDEEDLDGEDESMFENGDDDDQTQAEDNTMIEPENLLSQIPSLRESVLDLQTRQKQGGAIDQDAIQALGLSIAKQLTDLMGRNDNAGTKRKAADDDKWAYPDIPMPSAEKRQRRSLSPLPPWPSATPNSKSLWAPLHKPKRRRPVEIEASSAEPSIVVPSDADSARPEDANIIPEEAMQQSGARRCYNCSSASSIVWRKGPDGIMCNACGMYYYRYGLIRPVGPREESSESEESEPEPEPEASEDEGIDVQSHYSANTSRRRDEGPKKHHRFHDEEDVLILKLKEIDRLSWERIAKQLPARTAYAVQCRYSKKLHKRPHEARATLANQGYEFQHDENGLIVFTPAPEPKGFSDEEDELLLKLREEDKLSWEQVALSFPGRAPRALQLRFDQVAKKIMNEYKYRERGRPKNKKTPPRTKLHLRYSEEEDTLLKKLREVEKLKWTDLAARFPGRNALSLQKRYVRGVSEAAQQRQLRTLGVNSRDGEIMKHVRYTFEEDELLLRLREKDGLSWKEIEAWMPGRNKESIENRYEYIYEKKEHAKTLQTLAASTRNGTTTTQDKEKAGAQADDDELLQDRDTPMLTFLDSVQTYASMNGSGMMCGGNLTTPIITNDNWTQPWVAQRSESVAPKADSVLENGSSGMRYTPQEDSLIRDLRDNKRMDWNDIAKHLPGRGSKAIAARYSAKFGNPARRRSLPENQRTNNNLLRQAIDNNAIRRSMSTFDATGTRNNVPDSSVGSLPTRGGPFDKWYGQHLQDPTLPPSNLPAWLRPPQRNPSKLDSPPKVPDVFREAPLQGARRRPPTPSIPQPIRRMTSSTNIRSTLDGPPKVPEVFRDRDLMILSPAPRRPTREEPAEKASDEPCSPSTTHEIIATSDSSPSNSFQMIFDDDLLTQEYPATPPMRPREMTPQPDESISFDLDLTTPSRCTGQSYPYFASPSALVYAPGIADLGLGPVPPIEISCTPKKKVIEVIEAGECSDPERDTTIYPLRKSKSAKGLERQPDPETATETSQLHKLKPVNKRNRSQRQSADQASAAAKDIFEHVATDQVMNDVDVVHGKAGLAFAGDATSTEKSQDGNTGSDAEEEGTYSNDQMAANDTKKAEPPPHDWAELVEMALKSRHPTPMTSRKIRRYLMKTFPYFTENPPGDWRNQIRSTLHRRKEFKKVGNGFAAQWCLSGLAYDRSTRRLGRPMSGPAADLLKVSEPKSRRNESPEEDEESDPHQHGVQRSSVPTQEDGDGVPSGSSKADNDRDAASIQTDQRATEIDIEVETSFAPWLDMPDSDEDEDEDELATPMTVALAIMLRSTSRSRASFKIDAAHYEHEDAMPPPTHSSSDIHREPESTPAQLATRILRSATSAGSSSAIKSTPNNAILSSSPILTMKKPSGAVYSRNTTPGTGRSTLFDKPEHSRIRALRSSFSRSSPTYRSSSVPVPGSRMRIVNTAVRDGNDSDDELA